MRIKLLSLLRETYENFTRMLAIRFNFLLTEFLWFPELFERSAEIIPKRARKEVATCACIRFAQLARAFEDSQNVRTALM
jgi:hypothetical protein